MKWVDTKVGCKSFLEQEEQGITYRSRYHLIRRHWYSLRFACVVCILTPMRLRMNKERFLFLETLCHFHTPWRSDPSGQINWYEIPRDDFRDSSYPRFQYDMTWHDASNINRSVTGGSQSSLAETLRSQLLARLENLTLRRQLRCN